MRSDCPALMPVFRSQHQAEMLMWLMLHPDDEYSLSDLASRLEVAVSTLHREVVRLNDAGLISSRSLGRNRLLRADMSHPASRPLTELLEITFGPRSVIEEEFSIQGATFVAIFGSWAARYEGNKGKPPRDVDVLVVGDVGRAEVYEAADRASSRLGLEVNPVVRSEHEWDSPQDSLLEQIKATPYLVVLDRRGVQV